MRLLPILAVAMLVACQDTTAPQFTGTCRSVQTVSQSIADHQATAINFDGAGCSFAMGDSLILPAGTWAVESQLAWAVNANGSRGMCLFVNGVVRDEDGRVAMPTAGTITDVNATVVSDGHAVIRITGTHTVTGQLATMVGNDHNRTTYLSVTRVR